MATTLTTTAATIAAALREEMSSRTTYMPDRKLHALLYLAQGMCFVANDEALFGDPIVSTEQGVYVQGITQQARAPITDAQHAVVLTTASRYGALTAMDLEALIRGQGPWAASRRNGEAVVDSNLIRELFREQDEIPEGTLTGLPRSHRDALHQLDDDRPRSVVVDDPAEIAAFAAEVRSRM
jgi:uncharacterized phage-associated protein